MLCDRECELGGDPIVDHRGLVCPTAEKVEEAGVLISLGDGGR